MQNGRSTQDATVFRRVRGVNVRPFLHTERLRKININTLVGKLYQDVVAAKSLMDYAAQLLPFGLVSVATHFYSQAIIAKRIKSPFNLIITNVP